MILDYYTAPYWAEVLVEQKGYPYSAKVEEGFITLEKAKDWVKKHALSSKTASWLIESGGEIVLRGE